MKHQRYSFKKILCLLLVIIGIISLCGFSDVPKSYWGYSEIQKAYELGIIGGYEKTGYKGKFGPNDNITKEQLAKMIYKSLLQRGELKSTEDYSSKYEDELKASKISTWAYKFVSYGFEYGLWTKEDFQENGAFGGNAKLGRIMMSRWLSNAMGDSISAIRVIKYSDVDEYIDSFGYLDVLYRYNIMHGSAGKFGSKDDTNRAQAAAVCVRIVNRTNVGEKLENELITLYGTFTDFDESNGCFKYENDDTKILQIDLNAVIILNGKTSSFSELAKNAGKTMTISTVASGINVVVAHTNASSFAKKELVVSKYEARKAYTYVEVLYDGNTIPFCITENTNVYGNISVGSKINIFSDGCELIEVKVLWFLTF